MNTNIAAIHLRALVGILITISFFLPGVASAKPSEPYAPVENLAQVPENAQTNALPVEVRKAFLTALNLYQTPKSDEYWDITDHKVVGDWAAGYAILLNTKVASISGTPLNLIARYDAASGWKASIRTDVLWLTWIDEAPQELFSLEMKEYLRSQTLSALNEQAGQRSDGMAPSDVSAAAVPTFYFPWMAGTKAALSRGHHDGYNVDFLIGGYPGAFSGDVVVASADGKVIGAKWTGKSTCNCRRWSNGTCTGGWVYPNTNTSCPWTEANHVRILHADGSVTFYLHLKYDSIPSKFKKNYSTERPEPVKHGEKIGLEGSTGWSTGAHLHFGVYKSNNVASSNSRPFTIRNNGASILSSTMVNTPSTRKSWTSYNYLVPSAPALSLPANASIMIGNAVGFSWGNSSGSTGYYLEYTGPLSGNSGWLTTTAYSVSLPFGIYTWRVKARNAGGESPWSATWSVTVEPYLPAAPVLNLPLDMATTQQDVSFAWNADSAANEYHMEYSGPMTGNSGWIEEATFSVPSLTAGSYTWRVKARNADGEGPWSETWTFMVEPGLPASPVLSSPLFDEVTGPDVTLTWDMVDSADEYYVEYTGSSNGNSGWMIVSTYSVSALDSGTYTWRVKARNENGEGAWSEPWQFTVYIHTDVPVAPALVSPADAEVILPAVTFTWNDVAAGAEYFLEYTGPASGSSGWIGEQSHSVSSLAEGSYSWRVKARNGFGEGNWSDWRTFTIQSESYPPAAPGLISPAESAKVDPTVTLSWAEIADATAYYVEYTGPLSGNSGWISTPAFTVTSLYTGTYTWRVRSRNAAGESDWSPSRTFTVVVPPPVPAILSPANNATMVGVTSVTFTWSNSASATGYYLEYSGAKTGNSGWIAASNFVATSMPVGSYTWRVKARNSDRESSWSESGSFVLQAAPTPIVVGPTLTPAYGSTCTTAWYKFTSAGYNGTSMYVTMNTNQSSQSTNSAKWRPTISVAGRYKVEAYIGNHAAFTWPCSPYSHLSYDTSDARYKIYYSGGSTTKVIDQKPLSNAWALLGTYTFGQGTAGYITLSDLNGESNLTRSISFNMLRFTWVGP